MKSIIAVLLGAVIGYLFIPTTYIHLTNTLINIVLCLLLFFVGFYVGTNKHLIEDFKNNIILAIVIPLSIILGSIIGSIICNFFFDINTIKGLAIGSGYGWASLGSIVLERRFGVYYGIIGFLTNIIRWILSIILIPLASKLNFYSSIGLAGANSMDTAIEPIIKTTNQKVVLISILNGVILTLLTPIILAII